jgi:hypothetical protein
MLHSEARTDLYMSPNIPIIKILVRIGGDKVHHFDGKLYFENVLLNNGGQGRITLRRIISDCL